MNGVRSVLPLVPVALMAPSILAYVLMDGPCLGVGILCPLVARRSDTAMLFTSIAPFWDGSAAWLIAASLALVAGFPLTSSILMPQLRIPVTLMIAALILRAASYVLPERPALLQRPRQWMFALCSMLVAIFQGYILGLVVDRVVPHADSDGIVAVIGRELLPWVCGVGVLGSYALLGSCWLILKARGALQIFGRETALPALILSGVLMAFINVWMTMTSPHSAPDSLIPGHLALLWSLPVAVLIFCWRLKQSLWKSHDRRPLAWAMLLVTVGFAAIAVSVYPFIASSHTAFEVFSGAASLGLTGLGIVIVLLLAAISLSIARTRIRDKVPELSGPEVSSAPHIAARRTSGQRADLHLS